MGHSFISFPKQERPNNHPAATPFLPVVFYLDSIPSFQLNDANDIVNEEIHRLDHNADAAFETVNARFQTVLDNVERRRQEVTLCFRATFLH